MKKERLLKFGVNSLKNFFKNNDVENIDVSVDSEQKPMSLTINVNGSKRW